MNRILHILFITAFVLSVGFAITAHAQMVSYYDENGKVHYVNPKFMPIPPQYMDQVKPQLEAIKEKEIEEDLPIESGGQGGPNLEEQEHGYEWKNDPKYSDGIEEPVDEGDDDPDMNLPVNDLLQAERPRSESKVVVVYNGTNLPTRRLFSLLTTRKVKFKRYNVLTQAQGREIHQRFDNYALPLVIVDDETPIQGSLAEVKGELMKMGVIKPGP